jgi:L-2-hydroxyglutarate oxidase LhgO
VSPERESHETVPDLVDCVVVGAGVVGLAIARALAEAGREVIVLEREGGIGTETSSRNSEVIHAGIYYPLDSLKHRLCVAGRDALYSYCAERGIAHERCGKLIVAATAQERVELEGVLQRATANGVPVERLSGAEVARLEPELRCEAALLSPLTGIVDSHAFMLSLQGDAERAGAVFAFHAPFLRATRAGAAFLVHAGGEAPLSFRCRLLVNAAGLAAPGVAAAIEGFPAELIPRPYLAKGSYFTLAGRSPFHHLIYPVPVKGGLGIHLTLDLQGTARFGPDVEWIGAIDYRVDPSRREAFAAAIRNYWPSLDADRLQPGYSGIRPKIVPPEIGNQDFVIAGPSDHGVGGCICLFGIESPGLTASLAVAERVLAAA